MATFNSNEQIVYSTARSQGASDTFARIVLAQMKHESANFTSNVFKQNNNPMGMKYPSVRPRTYIAGKGTQPPGNEGTTPYARYSSLANATKDLFAWLNYTGIKWKTVSTIEQYAELLRQKSYMGNTQSGKNIYIAGLTNWFNKIKALSPAIISGGGAAILLIVAIIFIIMYFPKIVSYA